MADPSTKPAGNGEMYSELAGKGTPLGAAVRDARGMVWKSTKPNIRPHVGLGNGCRGIYPHQGLSADVNRLDGETQNEQREAEIAQDPAPRCEWFLHEHRWVIHANEEYDKANPQKPG